MAIESDSRLVGSEVRAELARQGKAQRDLAAHLGLSQTQVSHRLTGKVGFRVQELMQVAAYLGVPVTQFLPRTEPARRAS